MGFLDLSEEWMSQGFFDCDAEVGIKLQHPIDQISGFWRRARIFLLEIDSVDWYETLQIANRLLVSNE